MADLEECFFQIGIPEEQRDLFRILWFKDDKIGGEVEEWNFAVHVWGIGLSPFIATHCIHRVAEENVTNASQHIVDVIHENMNVDDILKSEDTEEQMNKFVDEIQPLFAATGFILTKFSSNSCAMLSKLPLEDITCSSHLTHAESDLLLTLGAMGLPLDQEKDTFSINHRDLVITFLKRGVLKLINTYYDPLGFSSVTILIGRCLYHKLCTHTTLRWDTILPLQIRKKMV